MQTKVFFLLYGTQGYISPDLHDRAVPGHDSYFYRHACECSVRAVLSVTPSQTHKNEKNTSLLLLCVHAHREAHSIGLLSAWSTRSRALIAHRAKEIRPPQDHLIPKCIQISIIIMCVGSNSHISKKSERQGHNEKTARHENENDAQVEAGGQAKKAEEA